MFHFCKNWIFFIGTVVQDRLYGFLNSLPDEANLLSEGDDCVTLLRVSHSVFLENLVTELLLTEEHRELFKNLSKLLSTCALFSSHLRRFLKIDNSELFLSQKYVSLIEKFDQTFSIQMTAFIANLRASPETSSTLLDSLDFNNFFSSKAS
jgi:hypothetical protein